MAALSVVPKYSDDAFYWTVYMVVNQYNSFIQNYYKCFSLVFMEWEESYDGYQKLRINVFIKLLLKLEINCIDKAFRRVLK